MAAPAIALLGECMLELSPAPDTRGQHYVLGVAGDTFNTAIALAELGCATEYLTGLGCDQHSDLIIDRAAQHGINSNAIVRHQDLYPGLYLIDNDEQGERYFSYWRRGSAAHQTLRDPAALQRLLGGMQEGTQWLFLSGISLALCETSGLETLLLWLADFRAGGGKVIYDSNYRPALWESPAAAAAAQQQLLPHVDIYLPGVEDELLIREQASKSALTNLMLELTEMEIVLKDGGNQMRLIEHGEEQKLTPPRSTHIIDTSGAGDAFNGGYIAARLRGLGMAAAASFGSEVAVATIARRGAVMPADAWQPLRQRLDQLAGN